MTKRFDEEYNKIMELRTVDNSHILKELGRDVESFKNDISVEDAKDYVKYFNTEIKKVDDLLDDYASGGSSLTKDFKLAINELERNVEYEDNDDDFDDEDIVKNIKSEFNNLKKALSKTHVM